MPHNTEYFEIDICYSHIYRRLTAFGSVDNRQLLRMHAMIDIRIFLCLSIHSENIWLIHHVSCMFFMKHKYMPRLFHTLCPWNYLFINRNIALWRVEQTPKLEPNKIKINREKKQNTNYMCDSVSVGARQLNNSAIRTKYVRWNFLYEYRTE